MRQTNEIAHNLLGWPHLYLVSFCSLICLIVSKLLLLMKWDSYLLVKKKPPKIIPNVQ